MPLCFTSEARKGGRAAPQGPERPQNDTAELCNRGMTWHCYVRWLHEITWNSGTEDAAAPIKEGYLGKVFLHLGRGEAASRFVDVAQPRIGGIVFFPHSLFGYRDVRLSTQWQIIIRNQGVAFYRKVSLQLQLKAEEEDHDYSGFGTAMIILSPEKVIIPQTTPRWSPNIMMVVTESENKKATLWNVRIGWRNTWSL